MNTSIIIGSQTISVYGFAAALGFLFALCYFKLSEKHFPDIACHNESALVYGIIGMFLGAKLLSLLTQLPQLLNDFPCLLSEPNIFIQKYLAAGFVFFGGMYGCFFAVWLYCKYSGVNFSRMMQYLLPMFPLTHAFGRIGCLLTGCCYGRPVKGWFSIRYSHSLHAPNGVSLFPVQAVESIIEFFIFITLLRMSKSNKTGTMMVRTYICSYSVLRFLLEYLRGDTARGALWVFSTSQWIALASIVLCVCWYQQERSRSDPPT